MDHPSSATLAACCFLLLSGMSGARADDSTGSDGLTRTLELRAHRALMQRRDAPDTTLAPFVTDGCSGGLSGIWRLVSDQFPEFAVAHEQTPPWESCCVVHDKAYHRAGEAKSPEDSFDARLLADDALRLCVIEIGQARKEQVAAHYGVEPESVDQAYSVIGDAMHLAVRFGGAPCSGLSWRWGFGYPDCSILNSAGSE